MTTGRSARLAPEDWTAEALVVLAESGLAAVAIEPLASRLGATKGSGYWHFASRAALVEATLLRWEREYTEQVIELTAQPGDPMASLQRLFRAVIHVAGPQSVELALLAAATDPAVAPVVRRVTERRIAYLVRLLTDLGFAKPRARQRALGIYANYLGHAQLVRTAPHLLPTGDDLDRYLDESLGLVTSQ